jgi:cytochrome c oxidase subunit 2
VSSVVPWSIAGALPLGPRGPQALAIEELFAKALYICAGIFVIVAGFVAYCVVRFRARGTAQPTQIEGNKHLEVAWTLLPFAVLAWLLFLTSRAMAVADPPVDREPDLTVVAHQWWWEVRYPSGVVAANEIHIPTGRALVVRVESADVVHDFWVPALGRKMDAIPGRSANIWIEADEPGIYLGACAEYCGAQHAWMRIRVVAQTAKQFSEWQARQLTPSPPLLAAAAVRGARVFQAKTCITCHSVGGVGQGQIGPNLAHIAERATLGSGVIDNTPAELGRWLKDPQQIKSGCHMPNAQLTDGEVSDLVAYFGDLK